MLIDRRRVPGTIWNLEQLKARFPLLTTDEPFDLDAFIYRGFAKHGIKFLEEVDGRFAVAFHDKEKRLLFLARDWIGETPFHWVSDRKGFFVANTISALQQELGERYDYRYMQAFPQSRWMEIDVSQVDPQCVSETSRLRKDDSFFDFAAFCASVPKVVPRSFSGNVHAIRDALARSLRQRMSVVRSEPVAVLLSGGLDSLSVALMLRALGYPFVAYTLSVSDGGADVRVAKEFAKRLGVRHRIVRVTEADILEAAPFALPIAETYHIYNYFCSVGMFLLGRQLADDGVHTAFCGEAVNEALGDYHDWFVIDPVSGDKRMLQTVNYERMRHSAERLLYVWGQASDRCKYNRQLGTGLAKHAASRMIKPFLHFGLNLECPYYDRQTLAHLITLPAEELEQCGGKPGLFQQAFANQLDTFGFPSTLIAGCQKVRFQDATEGGQGGLTPVLLAAGYTQYHLLELFNEHFGARFNPTLESERLAATAA